MTERLRRGEGAIDAPWTEAVTGRRHRWLLSRSFRFVWWGQVASQVGDGISKLALLWFVYSVTGSPLKTSVIGLLQTVPAIVLAPLIGVAVDRLPKKWLLIASDVVRAVVIGIIPCWLSPDTFTVGFLYVLVTLHAVATALFGPALTASIPVLVGRRQYTSANALLQSTTSVGIILGPALSGIGIAALSSQEVLCFNAVTYLISAACFVPLRMAAPAARIRKEPLAASMLEDMLEGLRFSVQGRPTLLLLTGIAALYTFATSAFTTLFPVFGRRLLDLGPVEVGYLWSILGIGLLATSLGLTAISAWDLHRRIRTIAVSSTVSGAGLCGLVWAGDQVAAAALMAVIGAGVGVLTPVAWGVLQELAPPHLVGRALAFYTMGAMTAAMAGMTFFGWMTGEFGAETSLLSIGLVLFLTAVSAAEFGRWIRRHAL